MKLTEGPNWHGEKARDLICTIENGDQNYTIMKNRELKVQLSQKVCKNCE